MLIPSTFLIQIKIKTTACFLKGCWFSPPFFSGICLCNFLSQKVKALQMWLFYWAFIAENTKSHQLSVLYSAHSATSHSGFPCCPNLSHICHISHLLSNFWCLISSPIQFFAFSESDQLLKKQIGNFYSFILSQVFRHFCTGQTITPIKGKICWTALFPPSITYECSTTKWRRDKEVAIFPNFQGQTIT